MRLDPQRPPRAQCRWAGFASWGQVGLCAALLPLGGAADPLFLFLGAGELGGQLSLGPLPRAAVLALLFRGTTSELV